jgi:DNA-binding GntR family transcriptional regulator
MCICWGVTGLMKRKKKPARDSNVPAPERVRLRLREAILNGELQAGTQLRQDELAQQFAISRIPVREALRQLEAEGLITYQPHRGAVVSTMSSEEIGEMFDIRIALEGRALRLAIDNMTEADLRHARELLRRYDKEGYPARWGELNWEFHSALYAPCDRPKLLGLIEANFGNVGRFIRLQVSKATGHDRPQAEHHRLVELCAEHRTDEAVKLLEEHIAYSQKVVRSSLRKSKN